MLSVYNRCYSKNDYETLYSFGAVVIEGGRDVEEIGKRAVVVLVGWASDLTWRCYRGTYVAMS